MSAGSSLSIGALTAEREIADDLCRAVFDFMEDEANDTAFNAMATKAETYRKMRGGE